MVLGLGISFKGSFKSCYVGLKKVCTLRDMFVWASGRGRLSEYSILGFAALFMNCLHTALYSPKTPSTQTVPTFGSKVFNLVLTLGHLAS